MRFSLKWILASMVYVAIAAAAFSFAHKTWIYAALLTVVTTLLVIYVAVSCIYSRGLSRACSFGFVIASAASMYYQTTGDQWVIPTKAILRDLGVPDDRAMYGTKTTAPRILPGPQVLTNETIYLRKLRAANAVATLAFGLLGSLVGLMAFRASRVDRPGCH